MIALENVSYKYPRSQREVISKLSCCFDRGECVAITGPNGRGKTTLTKLLVGILRPNAGRVLLDGDDAAKMDLFDIGRRAGYVFQDPGRQMFCATVFGEIAFGLKNMALDHAGVERVTREYLDMFRLTELSAQYPGKLSQGEKQRVMLAAVLAMGTDYVILDEPTSGLDMGGRDELCQLLRDIRESGRGVIFVSHERGFIEKCADRELVLA